MLQNTRDLVLDLSCLGVLNRSRICWSTERMEKTAGAREEKERCDVALLLAQIRTEIYVNNTIKEVERAIF